MKFSLPMLALLLCAFASLHCSSSLDQTSISVIDKKTNRKLLISKVDADVQIYGTIAETRLAITFSNHTDRTLEASVELPLAEGASISGYQLEVNGKLREGVIVDKDLGRQAFENVIRQRIDPGLLEKGDGNSFKTRIYPVPAKGSKTFVLNYIEPLKYDSKGRGKYSLPVTSRSRIEDFKIKVNGTGVSIYNENKLFGNSFVQNKTVRKKSFRPGSLDLILQQDLATRTGIIAKGRDGKEYFYIDGGKEAKRSAIPRPKLIQLVWDASHSAKHRDKAKDIALLKSYLHHFKEFDLDLKVVRNRVASYGKFEVKDGKCDKLISLLHSIQADGSSEFDDVSYRSSHYDLSLLFSDGIGDVNTAVVKHPVYVVNSSNLENSAYLNYLVNTSGGRKVSSQSNDALEKLVTTGIQLKSVSGDVSNVKILRSGGNSYAVGRIVGDNKIKLHYGKDGKTTSSENVSLTKAAQSDAPSLLWAQAEVSALSLNKKSNRNKIVKLAQQHHLVTDFTSLIVLDRIHDYARYRIIPKEPELRQEYYKTIKSVSAFDPEPKADLDDVYEEWNKCKHWHQNKVYKHRSTSILGIRSSGTVFSTPTSGLRSGDTAITRDSIDFFLNNPQGKSVFQIEQQKRGNINRAKLNLKQWNPDSLYLTKLTNASSEVERKQIYYSEKSNYGDYSAFYIDCAKLFYSRNDKKFALQIVSNLSELDSNSTANLRVLGNQYLAWNEDDLALKFFIKAKDLRPEEPQSYRDLALVYRKKKNYQKASDLLWKVVSRKWHTRFAGIEMIALNEWNHLYARKKKFITRTREQARFVYNITADIRVTLSWDTDNSDMDLKVTDPTGRYFLYPNTWLTTDSMRKSNNMRSGRGPEEVMVRSALKGEYKVEARYSNSREQTLHGPTTVTVHFIKNWGKANEEIKVQTLRLYEGDSNILIGSFLLN